MSILIRMPMLLIPIYIIIKLICMGIFYYTLRKYNYIISLIVYLGINVIINKFYTTISGSMLIDILFNFIIGIFIIIAYRKNIKMEDIKWFMMIGIIIDIILTFAISSLWRIVGVTITIYILIFGTLFMPYIMGVILSVIIIMLTRKKLIEKDNNFKNSIYVIIIILCIFVSRSLGYLAMHYLSAIPDKVYTEMKEINDSERLIGLSKNEVLALLGIPKENLDNNNLYIYRAGKITNYFFFGEKDFYDLFIWFDENDKVKSTKINLSL